MLCCVLPVRCVLSLIQGFSEAIVNQRAGIRQRELEGAGGWGRRRGEAESRSRQAAAHSLIRPC